MSIDSVMKMLKPCENTYAVAVVRCLREMRYLEKCT